ncbi:MAG: GspE/PulE family protein [Nitrospiraceae bacterium]
MERSTVYDEVFEYLIEQGMLTIVEREAAIRESGVDGSELESLLIDKYQVSRTELGTAFGRFYGYPYLPYDGRTRMDVRLLKNLSIDYLKRNHWVPLKRQGGVVEILIDNPHDLEKELDIKRAFPGQTIQFVVGLRRDIEQFLLAATGQGTTSASITDILGELVNEALLEQQEEKGIAQIDENDCAIVRLANQIIVEAYRLGASDIHIEPYSDRKEIAVRFRIDGTCFTYMRIPAAYRRAVVSRIKIMASLDIAERRKPQDGKILFKLGREKEIELRVATIPTAHYNEDVVLRLLTAKGPMPLEAMEFPPQTLQALKQLSEKPHGILLCVGPTGSGKTTTLHAILGHINTDERKIWTAEDPIEITQDGLRQVQVHPKIGFTFATAMRAFLRADPDVIMIGEMRDKETADIAIEASLTGHLVLSTLHTNSSIETVIRLLDLGCDAFNFADAMLGVLAMRLCKRLCAKCEEQYHPSEKEYNELVQSYGVEHWNKLGVEYGNEFVLYRGRGCEACNQTGFKGRVPLHELLVGTENMKNLIQSRARTTEILNIAMKEGMTTLIQDGVEKVLRGVTTYKQVRAVALK